MKFNTDRIIGLSAMLISLLTLVIFIYQTNLMRTQSRLSVTPRVSFFQIQSAKDSTVSISTEIINKGLGPAIIESIYIVHKGKNYPLDFTAFLEEVYPEIEKYGTLIQDMSMSRGSTLSAGEKNTLYTYTFKLSKTKELLEYLGIGPEDYPFTIEVIYSSIYKERWKANNTRNGHPIEM